MTFLCQNDNFFMSEMSLVLRSTCLMQSVADISFCIGFVLTVSVYEMLLNVFHFSQSLLRILKQTRNM